MAAWISGTVPELARASVAQLAPRAHMFSSHLHESAQDGEVKLEITLSWGVSIRAPAGSAGRAAVLGYSPCFQKVQYVPGRLKLSPLQVLHVTPALLLLVALRLKLTVYPPELPSLPLETVCQRIPPLRVDPVGLLVGGLLLSRARGL